MGAGPDTAPTLSLDPPLYVLRLWGLASYNPQTGFEAKGLLSGNSLDRTPKDRGNGHTTLHFTFYILHFTFYILHFTFYVLHFKKCKTKYTSVTSLPVSASFFVV